MTDQKFISPWETRARDQIRHLFDTVRGDRTTVPLRNLSVRLCGASQGFDVPEYPDVSGLTHAELGDVATRAGLCLFTVAGEKWVGFWSLDEPVNVV